MIDKRKDRIFKKMVELEKQGKFKPGEVGHITVLHDDYCHLLKGIGPCNCNPEIRVGKPNEALEMKNRCPLEEWEQSQVIRWKRANQIRFPELQLLHASMNGIRVSTGLRTKMKKQGLEPGFPDLMLDVARRGYHGLRIELKRLQGGTIGVDQKRVMAQLKAEGYFVEICRGHKAAIDLICWYLKIDGGKKRPRGYQQKQGW